MTRSRLTKLRLNSPGVLDILQSPGVQADVNRRADAIQAGLPTSDGEEWVRQSGTTDRAWASVGTGNRKAAITAAETHALLRAIDRGRF